MVSNLPITADQIREFARDCGFELAGVAAALPLDDFAKFDAWRSAGKAGEMTYLTDHRGDKRSDPRSLLASAQSIICVGKLYNTPYPYSTGFSDSECAWISRYAWGDDYHDVLRVGLEALLAKIAAAHPEPFDSKICVDTAPLLERSFARAAGLGWIGKNTCLINEGQGSWFFLGELLLSIPLTLDMPPPDRCGTCRRCIDACPTAAIVASEDGSYTLDARLCISYLTIEKRGAVPAGQQTAIGNHVFGCDICQDVCPWNRAAPPTDCEAFAPKHFAPPLVRLAALTIDEFRSMFRHTPIWRAKYSGFLRNVAIAMGNSKRAEMEDPLERLANHPDRDVAAAAHKALQALATV